MCPQLAELQILFSELRINRTTLNQSAFSNFTSIRSWQKLMISGNRVNISNLIRYGLFLSLIHRAKRIYSLVAKGNLLSRKYRYISSSLKWQVSISQFSHRIFEVIFPEFSLSFWWFPPIFPWVFSSKLICFSLSLLFCKSHEVWMLCWRHNMQWSPCNWGSGALWAPSRSRAEPWWGSRSRSPYKLKRSYSLH